MPATIKIKNSSTASAVPTSSDLVQGELAVNVTDKRIFTENASGTVVELGTNPSILTLPDGSASAPTLTNDGDTNTGIFFPAADTVGITTGGSERARVDSSGNMGLGVTPSAWSTGFKAIQVGAQGALWSSTSTAATWLTRNTFLNTSGSFRYIDNGYANALQVDNDGMFKFYTAASGTAGNAITFTQAMTLDASGNLGIGTTSPGSLFSGGRQLVVGSGSGAQGMTIYTGTSSTGGIYFADGTSGNDPYQGQVVYNHSVDAMSFMTASSERARIDSSGNLLVGTTSAITGFGLAKVNTSTTDGCFAGQISSSTGHVYRATTPTDGYPAYFYNSTTSSSVGYIRIAASSTTYATSSDYRLKENVAPMTNALATVAALKPCTYTWKVNGAEGQGFIAHELAEVVPDCVTGEKDAVDANGNPVYQGIDTSFLVATLTAAIQELKAEFDAYKASHP